MADLNQYTVNIVNAEELYVQGKKIEAFDLGALTSLNAAYGIGIRTDYPRFSLDISGTDAMRVPTGTSDERPGGQNGNQLSTLFATHPYDGNTAKQLTGCIRYNTTTNEFEGYGDSWSGLGGVTTPTKQTKITADDTNGLKFYTSGATASRMVIDSNGNIGINIAPTSSYMLNVSGKLRCTNLNIAGTDVTATAAEINYLDISTLGTSQANKVLTANSQGNVGIKREPGSLYALDVNGDINFSGNLYFDTEQITATAAEINYLDGVMSPIQTQINTINSSISTNTTKLAPITSSSGQVIIAGSKSDTLSILSLRSGNDSTAFNNGAQIAFGHNNTDDYQHFIQTRHEGNGADGNSIDFYVSDGTQNNTVNSGSIHTMSLNGGKVCIGTRSPFAKFTIGFSDDIVPEDTGNTNLHTSGITAGKCYIGIGKLEYLLSHKKLIGFGYVPASTDYYPAYIGYQEITTSVGTYGDLIFGTRSVTASTTEPSERMRINHNGNVGIGTTSPRVKLHVGDITGFEEGNLNNSTGVDWDTNAMLIVHPTPTSNTALNDPKPVLYLGRKGTSEQAYGALATFSISRWENSGVNSRTRLDIKLDHATPGTNVPTDVMTLRSDGNVGIGTTSPDYNLDIDGQVRIGGAIYIKPYSWAQDNGSNRFYPNYAAHGFVNSGSTNGYGPGIAFKQSGSYAASIHFEPDVTIGGSADTADDWKILLKSDGYINTKHGIRTAGVSYFNAVSLNVAANLNYEYYRGTNSLHQHSTAGVPDSQRSNVDFSSTYDAYAYWVNQDYASGADNMYCSQYNNAAVYSKMGFMASSDRRIKKNIIDVPDDISLEKLRNIPCKYYDYIDSVNGKTTIGFIAQEVKEIFPIAVKITKDITPSEMLVLDENNSSWEDCDDGSGEIYYRLTIHDLCNNELDQIYTFYDQSNNKINIITETNKFNSFAFTKKFDSLFCYGKFVNDFHALDKQKLFALNFSATQEIDRIQQAEKAKLEAAEAKLAAAEAKLAAAEAKLVAAEVEIAALKAKNETLESTLTNLLAELRANNVIS
jgi:hypothetical protein